MYACLSSNPLWIIALIKGDPRTEWHKTMYYYTYLLSSIVIQDSRGASLTQIITKYEKVAQSAGRGWYPAGYCDMWYLSLYNRIPRVTHFLLISQISLNGFPPTQIPAQFILSMHTFSSSQYWLRWDKMSQRSYPKPISYAASKKDLGQEDPQATVIFRHFWMLPENILLRLTVGFDSFPWWFPEVPG